MLAHPFEGIGIVEVIVLDEGDSGLGRLLSLTLVYDLCDATYTTLHLYILTYHSLVAQIKGETYDDAEAHLTDNLKLTMQTLLITLEHFDIVIGKAQATQPHRSDAAVTPEVVPPVEMSLLPVVSFNSSILLLITST